MCCLFKHQSVKKLDLLRQFCSEKIETMNSLTLGHFIKTPKTPDKPMTRLCLLPSDIYILVNKHLSLVDKLCVELALTKEQRTLTEKESEEDCKEDEIWYEDDYDSDFLAQWDEDSHNSDYDYEDVNDESDK